MAFFAWFTTIRGRYLLKCECFHYRSDGYIAHDDRHLCARIARAPLTMVWGAPPRAARAALAVTVIYDTGTVGLLHGLI